MIFTVDNLQPVFGLLEQTKGVAQVPEYHPEGDVYNHTLQVMAIAFRETTDIDLIFAAILHDVGKIIIRSGHEEKSVEMVECFSSAKTIWLIEHHMRIRTLLKGVMKKKSKVEYLLTNPWLPELIHLVRMDNGGRVPGKVIKWSPEIVVDNLNEIVYNKYRG